MWTTYHRPSLKKNDSSSNRHQLPAASPLGLALHEPVLHPHWDSDWLALSWAGKHSCREFMNAMAMSRPEDSVPQPSSLSCGPYTHSFCPFFLDNPQLAGQGDWYRCPNSHLFSTLYQVESLCWPLLRQGLMYHKYMALDLLGSLRLTLNSWSSCIYLPSGWGMSKPPYLIWTMLGMDPRALCMLGKDSTDWATILQLWQIWFKLVE